MVRFGNFLVRKTTIRIRILKNPSKNDAPEYLDVFSDSFSVYQSVLSEDRNITFEI